MKQIVLIILSTFTFVGLANAGIHLDARKHQCFEEAIAKALETLNREGDNNKLAKLKLKHHVCGILQRRPDTIACYDKHEKLVATYPSSFLKLEHLTGEREALDFHFGNILDNDWMYGVRIRMRLTRKENCKFKTAKIYVDKSSDI